MILFLHSLTHRALPSFLLPHHSPPMKVILFTSLPLKWSWLIILSSNLPPLTRSIMISRCTKVSISSEKIFMLALHRLAILGSKSLAKWNDFKRNDSDLSSRKIQTWLRLPVNFVQRIRLNDGRTIEWISPGILALETYRWAPSPHHNLAQLATTY